VLALAVIAAGGPALADTGDLALGRALRARPARSPDPRAVGRPRPADRRRRGVGVGGARAPGRLVGYEYNYAGPWTLAPRANVGLATPLGRAELFLDVLGEAPLLPSPEVICSAGIGVRVRL